MSLRTFDAVVVGLGAMGSAAAMHLARRGQRVLGVDRYAPPHDRGSSHGRSRLIRCAYSEGAEYVPLALRSWDQWLALGAATGTEILTATGALYMGPPGAELVEGARVSAERWSLEHEVLDAGEVTRRWPVFTPGAGTVAVHEPQAGFVRPEAGVTAMLEQAATAGAVLRTGVEVTGWESRGAASTVALAGGETVETGALVVTAGPWAPEVLGGPVPATLPLEIERQVQFWFAPLPGGDPARHPVFMHAGDDGLTTYGAPAHDGFGTKAGIHYGGVSCTPATVERAVAAHEIEAMRCALCGYAPTLAGEVVDASTCLYTNTPDRHFVIGFHPDHPGARVVVATGFSGHGFKFAPVVGEILADLAMTGTTPHGIALFDPGRFTAG